MQTVACTCGAMVEDAATACPACGRAVISVSLEPIRFDTPQKQLSNQFGYHPVLVAQGAGEDVYRVVEPVAVRDEFEEEERRRAAALLRRIRRQTPLRRWPLEKNWWQCIPFPLRASGALMGVAFGASILFLPLPPLLQLVRTDLTAIYPLLFWSAIAIALCSYTCDFLCNILASALDGEAGTIPYPDDVVRVTKSVLRWVVSFLAGPAVLVLCAAWYWVQSGGLTIVDRIILTELLLVAGCYWFFALFSVIQANSLRAVAPLSVVRIVRELGYPAGVVVLFCLAMVFMFLPWLFQAVDLFHRGRVFVSWFSVLIWASSILFAVTYLLRWLGVRHFRSTRNAARTQEAPVVVYPVPRES